MTSRAIAFAVLLAACKSNAPPPPPAPIASASAVVPDADADAGAVVAADVDASVDAGEEEAGAAVAAASGPSLPPRAKGAAWSVVRWDMAKAEIEAAFDKAGVKAETKRDPKSGAERIAVRGGAWSATIYLTAGKPAQIVVMGDHLSKDAAASVVAKTKERAGAPLQSSERTELRWRRPGAGATTFVVGSDGAAREEYVREGASGEVAFAKLTWGMPPAAAQQALANAGFDARIAKASATSIDPCSVPNAPPDCAKKAAASSVVFTKGEREGNASFDAKGLVQVVVSGPTGDRGAARRAELERALGKPTTMESGSKSSYADDVAKIDLEVRERLPDGGASVIETYRPKK